MPIDPESSSHVYEACKLSEKLYVLNPFLPQQNFYSQQLRALALAAEIGERHLRPGNRRVCIVGAGIAGRTLAAAFLSQGASVTLVEKERVDFAAYLNASHRELHPNIIFWPFQDATPATALPFLNWAQAPVTEVIEAVKREWEEAFASRISPIIGEVEKVERDADPLVVKFKRDSQAPINANFCVLATGFLAERQFGRTNTPRYWSPSSVIETDREVMVSGSGDGGLIDALSPILGKDVTTAAHVLAVRLSKKPIVEDVKAAELRRRAHIRPPSKDSEDACPFYSTVTLEREDADEIEPFLKRSPPPKVTLLHQSTSAYSFSAAPINKILLSHFSNGPSRCVTHIKGRLVANETEVAMEPEGGRPETVEPSSRFEKVMIRHGAPPAASTILDRADLDRLAELASRFADVCLLHGYDEKRYKWGRKGIGKLSLSTRVLSDSVRRAIGLVARAYKLEVRNVKIRAESLQNGKPIEIRLPSDDIKRVRRFGLFPLRVGPAVIELAKSNVVRGIDYD